MIWNTIQDLTLDIIELDILNKLKENRNVPIDLYNHFHTTLSENNKTYHIIPIEKNEQTGSSINNIIINDKDLNNGILRVRY